MNMILLFKEDLIGKNKVVLKGRRHKHIVNILKTSVGVKLCVGLVDNNIGTGTIVKQTTTEIIMDVHIKQKPPKEIAINTYSLFMSTTSFASVNIHLHNIRC